MQSDNDIQIWMSENDIIEKVRSLMFLPTRDVIKRKPWNVGGGGAEKPNIYIVS